jgi:hypothetical protein
MPLLSFREEGVARLRVNPHSSMTCSTRLRVPGATSGRLFRTRETVGIETPAFAAISAIVLRLDDV